MQTKEYSEKLYRVVTKKDNHINTKVNPDGSVSAIQFTNDKNALNGPVDIVEVDNKELRDIEPFSKPRTFKEIVIEEIVIPAASELVFQALTIGYNALCQQVSKKVVPKLKRKFIDFSKDSKIFLSGIKDALSGKEPKAVALSKKALSAECNNSTTSKQKKPKNNKVLRSQTEVAQIVNVMQTSAITLVACIRLLNNTVLIDDGSDPQIRLEIQKNLQELSSEQIKNQIDLLLDDKNSLLLDEASRLILISFHEGFFLVDGHRIPISNYLN